jgi:4-coumarate--CoA ligase
VRSVITKARARTITRQFAHFLRRSYGIGADGPGRDVVVAVSSGQSALPCLFYGVVAADGIYSAASSTSTAADLARQVRDGPGRLLVCSRDVAQLASDAARDAGLPLSRVLVLESHPVLRLESVDGRFKCDFRGELDWRVITDSRELEKSKICILYSSGTTGLPKGEFVPNMCSLLFPKPWLPLTYTISLVHRRPRLARQHGL